MGIIEILALLRTASNALGEAKTAYDAIKGNLGKEHEAELQAALDKVTAERRELEASVLAKLDAAGRAS